MKFLFLFGTIIFSNFLYAEIVDRECTPGIIEKIKVQNVEIGFDGMRGQCVITFGTPTVEINGHDSSRAYKASDLGLLFIHSSFYNPKSTKLSGNTGSKAYALLPVINTPKAYANSETGEYYLMLASGEKIYFNGQTGMIDTERTTSPRFSEDQALTHKNESGVKILSRNGVVVDLGYRQGGNPLANENNLATITDPQNKKCTIKINELYDTVRFDHTTQRLIVDNNLTEAQTDRYIPKATGAELAALIQRKATKCRQLDLSTLSSLPEVENVVRDVQNFNTSSSEIGAPASSSSSPAVINSDREAIEVKSRHDMPTSRPVRDNARILDR